MTPRKGTGPDFVERLAAEIEVEAVRARARGWKASDAKESLFCLAAIACAIYREGGRTLLEVRDEPSRTPLQQWCLAFLAEAGPRRASLARWGMEGRGRGGRLFLADHMSHLFLFRNIPLPLTSEFCCSMVAAFSEPGLSDDLVEIAALGERLGMGSECDVSEPEPVIPGGFGGPALARARAGCPAFTILARNKAEWAAARARIWSAWPKQMSAPPLDVMVRLAPGPLTWPEHESGTVEFKAGFEWDPRLKRKNGELRQSVLRSVAGLLNSEGGRVILGITDQGVIAGLEAELKSSRARNPLDGLMQKIAEGLRRTLTPSPVGLVSIEPVTKAGRTLIILGVKPSPCPTLHLVKNPSSGEEEERLYLRQGPRTILLAGEELLTWTGLRAASSESEV